MAGEAEPIADIFERAAPDFDERLQRGSAKVRSILTRHHPIDAMLETFARSLDPTQGGSHVAGAIQPNENAASVGEAPAVSPGGGLRA